MFRLKFLYEVWRPVVGYEGLYEVSNLGRVRGLSRIIERNKQGTIMHKEQLIKPRLDKRGYWRVGLYDNQHHHKYFFVHRLVAQAFLPNPNNYPIINHKDQNPQNNYVWVNYNEVVDTEKSNIEWCTQQYNCNYADRNERLAAHFEKKISQIKDGIIIAVWKSGTDIERKTGYKRRNIQRVCNGEYGYKSAYGYKWEWA